MVRCMECGTRNDEDAKFCNNCGAAFTGVRGEADTEWRNKAEDECAKTRGGECAKTRGGRIFWGLVVTFIGVWLIFEFGIKNIEGLPQWVYDLTPWWIIPVIIGVVVIIAGIRLVSGKGRDTCD